MEQKAYTYYTDKEVSIAVGIDFLWVKFWRMNPRQMPGKISHKFAKWVATPQGWVTWDDWCKREVDRPSF